MNNFLYEVTHDKPEELFTIEMMPTDVSITDIAVIDIESTGTEYDKSVATILGGTIMNTNGVAQTTQFFLTQKEYEKDLFESFYEFIRNKKYLVTFNGDNFDIPYIDNKFLYYGIPIQLSSYNGIDFYKWAKSHQTRTIKALQHKGIPYEKIKKPFGDRLNLKSIERYFGIDREDEIYGVTMIEKYHKYEFYYRTSNVMDPEEFKIRASVTNDPIIYDIYVKEGEENARIYLRNEAEKIRNDLLLHNREDTYNLIKLFGLASSKLFAKT